MDSKSNMEARRWMCRCGYSPTHNTNVTGKGEPREGDLCCCMNCGTVHARRMGMWCEVTQGEWERLPIENRVELRRIQMAIRATTYQQLGKSDPRT